MGKKAQIVHILVSTLQPSIQKEKNAYHSRRRTNLKNFLVVLHQRLGGGLTGGGRGRAINCCRCDRGRQVLLTPSKGSIDIKYKRYFFLFLFRGD